MERNRIRRKIFSLKCLWRERLILTLNRYELMYRFIPNATFSSLATFMYRIYPLSLAGEKLLPPIEKLPYITEIPLIVRSGSDSLSS